MDGDRGIAYNPRRVMGLDMTRGVVLLLAGTLAGCALFSSSGRVIYQQGRTTVQLERDPSAGGTFTSGGNSHPASIKSAQLASLLRGVQVRSEQGLVGAILSLAVPAEEVFTEEEVMLLAPLLADGLAQAAQSERVSFTHWSSQPGRRNGPLSGHIAIREPYLRFGLNDHPTVGWQDPEDPSASKLYTLEFQREGFVKPSSEEERSASRRARPMIQIDYRRYLALLQDQGGPSTAIKDQPVTAPAATRPPSAASTEPRRAAPASDSETVKDLRRQVKELTDSNQELRATLKALQERRDQSTALTEELARIRQELAETKQLLADKVLELNRLKNKSGGTGKGKK